MRRKIMGIRVPPWYQTMPAFGMLAAAVGLATIPFVMTYLHANTDFRFARSIGLAYILTLGSVFVLAAFWTSWVSPWFASDDPDYAPTKSPRQVARDLTMTMWTMSMIAWCFTALIVTTIVVLDVMDSMRHPIHINLILTWVIVGTSLGAIPLLWVIPISRRVRQRVRDTARRRCVCFACGYDLRGNPEGACPECGHHDAGQ